MEKPDIIVPYVERELSPERGTCEKCGQKLLVLDKALICPLCGHIAWDD